MRRDCSCDPDTGDMATPLSVANRPGLPALVYRVGTHASFFQTMKARLSSFVPGGEPRPGEKPPLAGLTTRDASDPAIAMLDAWALVGDVLTFYQERIANEGFLRTAVERRSTQALAALVGYALRPGVAASAYLSYAVQDPGSDEAVPIAAGSRVQSMPESGALPQSFETSAALVARASWTRLSLRTTAPHQADPTDLVLYFKGVATNLKPNDRLLFVIDGTPNGDVPRVASVEPQFRENRTKVTLQPAPAAKAAATAPAPVAAPVPPVPKKGKGMLPDEMFRSLMLPPALHPRSAVNLVQDVGVTLSPNADAAPQLLATFKPALRSQLYTAISNAEVPTKGTPVEVHALRLSAAPFGNNAPLDSVFDDYGKLMWHREWTLQKLKPAVPAFEAFTIETSVVLGEHLVLEVDVQIGPHRKHAKGEITETARTINIDYPEAGDTVIVELTGLAAVGSTDADKVELSYKFVQRRVTINLSAIDKDSESDIVVAATGCEPVTVTLVNATQPKRLALMRSVTAGQGPVIRIEGNTRTLPTDIVATEQANAVSLDTVYDKVMNGSWVVIERPDRLKPIIARAKSVASGSRADYGITGRTTRIELEKTDWLNSDKDQIKEENFAKVIRGTTVYADSEKLELAEKPVSTALQGGTLELDGVHSALEPGRWLIIEGERVDVPQTSGIRGAELVMLAGIEHSQATDTPGEKLRTVLKLASPLAYQYALDSVTIHGNVVRATHGETRTEVLGSGNGALASAQFALRQGPLTYVSAVTPSGVESSLQVRVNDVLWHEADNLNALGPNDRRYVTRDTVNGKTLVVFGNGRQGARLPTGADNVQALYRTGLGSAGNVPAGKLSLLVSRPLGVSAVTNPIVASGGADLETQDQARRNTPLTVMALDRLVSVSDYGDFARTFAGVGKASATRLAVGHRQTVYLTVGGADEAPLDASSDLCRNLAQAVQQFGDPHQPVLVTPGEAVLVVIVAKVRVDADHLWDKVEPAIRAALYDTLGYDRRDFGQDMVLGEIISTMQGVDGVDYVDVDRLDSTTFETLMDDLARISAGKPPKPRPSDRVRARPSRRAGADVLPAQVVYLSAAVPSLLNLAELT